MMMHMFKILRKRMRGNLLLLAELMICFLVVFGVGITLFNFYDKFNQPLGFDYEDVSSIRYLQDFDESMGAKFRKAADVLRQRPEVEHVEVIHLAGFADNTWGTGGLRTQESEDAPRFWTRYNLASDGVADMLNMNILHGRWFGPEDDGLTDVTPVVLNRKLAINIFGREDVAGQTIWRRDGRCIVVGVIDDFRQYGEAHEAMEYMFERYTWDDLEEGRFFTSVSYKVKPGTPANFESDVIDIFQREAPELGFSAHNWVDSREFRMKRSMVMVWALILITGFLLLMVVLGMLGVLWQNITSRTQEIGLRRALGAPADNILRQIIAELLLLSLAGVVLGSFVALQLPLTGWFANLELSLIMRAIGGSALVIMMLSAICAWYPGYMAMRVTPADSLRYE